MYKLIKNKITGEIQTINKIDTGIYIPFDRANIDYQEYLKWLAEGNTPEPADGEQA